METQPKKKAIGLQSDAEVDWSEYEGILVVLEQRAGIAKNVSWQLLGEARRLANQLGTSLSALVMGNGVERLATEAISYGADRVYLCDDGELADYRTRPYSRVCMSVIRTYKPEIVLFGATYTGRDLAGAIATHLPTGLTADCTSLEVDEERLLHATRPAFSEKMVATILCKQFKPQMATARPGVFKAHPKDVSRSGEIIPVEYPMNHEAVTTEVLEFIEDLGSVNLEDAEVIVAGGRGVGGPEGFSLLQELAQVLGGTVGATRVAVEAGWIEHPHQVGQTGATVRPKLYIAAGISGAIQHTVGMQNSECIIAINRDKDAPIFQIAHYGIVGDLFEVIPRLTDALRSKRQSGEGLVQSGGRTI